MTDIAFVGIYRIEGEDDLSHWSWAWIDPPGEMVFAFDYQQCPDRYLPAWEELPLENSNDDAAELFSVERRIRSVRNSLTQVDLGDEAIRSQLRELLTKMTAERAERAAAIAARVRHRQITHTPAPKQIEIDATSNERKVPIFAPRTFGVFASGLLRDVVPEINLSIGPELILLPLQKDLLHFRD